VTNLAYAIPHLKTGAVIGLKTGAVIGVGGGRDVLSQRLFGLTSWSASFPAIRRIASLALTRSIFGTVNARRRRASVPKCLAAFCD